MQLYFYDKEICSRLKNLTPAIVIIRLIEVYPLRSSCTRFEKHPELLSGLTNTLRSAHSTAFIFDMESWPHQERPEWTEIPIVKLLARPLPPSRALLMVYHHDYGTPTS